MDPATCAEEIAAAFHPQESAVLAVRPVDGGTLFRSEILAALDAVCSAFEDEQTGWDVAPKCLTSVPLLENRKGAPPRAVVIRDELPLKTPEAAARVERLARGLEFGIGDVMNAEGTVAYVHLPLGSFDGVDLPSVATSQLDAQPLLEGAFDGGDAPDAYRALAGDGPSARFLVGLYDAGVDDGLKEPKHLAALEAFQERAEGLKQVAQTFTVVDELKTARQGLRGGNPEQYALPATKGEAAQIMLALSMSPGAKYGPRVDSRERVGLVRVNFVALDDAQAERAIRKLEGFLAASVAEGADAFFCHPEAAGASEE